MLTDKFLYAGKATFTISNDKGQHYTFKVSGVENFKKRITYFVKVRTGEEFTYLGMIRNHILITTKASKLPSTSLPFQVFNFAVRIMLGQQKLPKGYKLQHEGKCGMCNRPLTNPESIETGLGPICSDKLK